MKIVKALLGLAVVGAFLYGVSVYRSLPKEKQEEILPALQGPLVIEDGLEVPLVLVTPLDSGGAKEGQEVKMVVPEDVKGKNGRVVIKQGAIATAKVTKSRGATLLSALSNEPARLEVQLVSVEAANGKTVALRSAKTGQSYEFNQENTRFESKLNVVDAAGDPGAREVVVGMANRIITGQQMSDKDRAKADEQLNDLAKKYGLSSTQALLKEKGGSGTRASDVAGIIQSVQKGDLKGLTGLDVALAAKAAGEIVDLGSGIDSSLRGIFKGNNIHAKVGLPMKAYVAKR